MAGATPHQKMSYRDHVKKRREEKGCLYAWYMSILVCIYIQFMLCCLYCVAVVAVSVVNAARVVAAVAVLRFSKFHSA
ncbi:hypothetical protein PanWU01x14_110050 [Parasponia andersonii]|uniref:Transmembrane protein n=1 Tax=Parasponia andersonii TaxID=3476 RepID=A0A2P5CZ69_PARAD|nr:hypothetical protein PanWU01x14_110050 [Parasponia andersonii]